MKAVATFEVPEKFVGQLETLLRELKLGPYLTLVSFETVVPEPVKAAEPAPQPAPAAPPKKPGLIKRLTGKG